MNLRRSVFLSSWLEQCPPVSALASLTFVERTFLCVALASDVEDNQFAAFAAQGSVVA